MSISRSRVARANTILSAVEWLLNDDDPELSLGMYSNGREQGYTLKNMDNDYPYRMVAFSEYRSSDTTVVYFGTVGDFAGGLPSDKLWENARHFAYNDIHEAASFIVDYLRSGAVNA